MQVLRFDLKLSCLVCVCLLLSACSGEKAPPQTPVESEVVVTSVPPAVPAKTQPQQQMQPEKSGAEPVPSPQGQSVPAAETSPVLSEPQEVEKIYRPSDRRVVRNRQRLALLGIECYESPHLKLYTDIAPQIAQGLPAVLEQAWPSLEQYFGVLPPDREGTVFQVTGYIMQDRDRFEKAGVIPHQVSKIINGRHLGAQFWMNAQTQEYYLRHLMLHEYTHCYSMIMENIGAPVWYLEGIAESMATHRRGADGKLEFNVMPHNKEDFIGLGRIALIQEEVQNAPPKTILDVMQFATKDFVNDDAGTYAWSWALCQFFDKHPRYQTAFRDLAHHMQGTEFAGEVQKMIGPDLIDVNDAWLLFTRNLQPGYDSQRAMISFQPGKDLALDASVTKQIASDRGWQSSGVHVARGETYEVNATGMFTLAQQPKPWKSTADGITFQYFGGQPLGRLLMMVRPDPGNDPVRMRSLLREYPLGTHAVWMAPASGTLYFRVNDAWDSLNNNQGTVEVSVTRKPQVSAGTAE